MSRSTVRLFLCAIWSLFALSLPASDNAVVIKHQIKNRVVTVAADAQIQQVVLEQKTTTGWKPLSVAYPTTLGATSNQRGGLVRPARNVTFKVSAAQARNGLRVVGYRSAKFPSRFLRGQRTFDRENLEMVTTAGTLFSTNGQVPRNGDLSIASTSASVVESDIWQIVGDQIYFFNQYRGLQILDVSDPTRPVRTGSLRLPASGEQMFVLNAEGTEVALLGRSNDRTRQGAATVWLIRLTNGVPALVSEVPLDGAITDSRLMGSKLHVLCSRYAAGVLGDWSGQAVLTTLDLSDLETPETLGSVTTPSNFSVLQAAGGHLLLGTSHYAGGQNHQLHLIDITAAPVILKTFALRGQVQDKFKVSIVNEAVVAVTLNWQNWNNRQTWVETFPVAGSSVTPLARMELEGARGETLHATRFDGDRLYVVTFRNIDPLFVVDLADPAAPVLSGVLEVPGWSTYLEPLGDRLLAVGVEDGRVTVSLFDVSDVSAPTLLSRLPLGPEGSFSWSEANYDEKAVEYLAEQGLVMVPFQSTDWSVGHSSKAVQIVAVGDNTLTLGATIQHDFNPRRGSLIGDHFVSLSGQELLVHRTEAGSEDPLVVRLPLAWRTDRVVPVGDFLVQIEDGNNGFRGWFPGVISFRLASFDIRSESRLRVTSSRDPDTLLDEIDLGQGLIVGVTQKEDRLYLAQLIEASGTTPARLRTLALNLSSAPLLTEVGRAEHELTGINLGMINTERVQPHWMKDDTLIWFMPMETQRFFWMPIIGCDLPVAILPGPIAADASVSSSASVAKLNDPSRPAVAQPAAVLCPVQVNEASLLASTAQTVQVNGESLQVSAAFSEAGFLFFSYDTAFEKQSTRSARGSSVKLIPYAPRERRLASWLQVIDWRTATPTLREPVSIPGPLLSVADVDAQGAVLLTHRHQRISSDAAASRSIQASAYDGVTAWLLDTYITATSFYNASTADAGRVYLTREGTEPGVVSVGYNATTGRLSQISSWTTNESPQMLNVARGHLIASSYGNLELAGIAPASGQLTPLASYETPANLWLQVDQAVITPELDIWIPAGDYGVEFLQHDALVP